jgi:DNA-directed RNA polymerase specialized sigma24 family protein
MEFANSIDPTITAGPQERDRHIVDRVLSGDAEVFRLLVDRYAPVLMQYAYAMNGDATKSALSVRAGLALSFQALSRIPQRGNFLPFAIRALRRNVMETPAQVLVHGDTLRTGLAAAIRDRHITPETLRAVRSAVLNLPSEIREAFVLTHVLEIDVADGAYVSGVDEIRFQERCAAAQRQLEQVAGLPVTDSVIRTTPSTGPTMDELQ